MSIEPGSLCMIVNMPPCLLPGPENGQIVTALRYVGTQSDVLFDRIITVRDAWEVDSPRYGEGIVQRHYLMPITGPRAALEVEIEKQIPEAA